MILSGEKEKLIHSQKGPEPLRKSAQKVKTSELWLQVHLNKKTGPQDEGAMARSGLPK